MYAQRKREGLDRSRRAGERKKNGRNQSAGERTRVGAIKKKEYEGNRKSETKKATSRAYAHTLIYLSHPLLYVTGINLQWDMLI